MSQFSISEELEQFKQLARDFTEGEIAPRAAEFDASGEFPSAVVQKAWEIGLVNFQVPEELGGLGLKFLDTCIILEELAKGCAGIAAAIEGSAIAQLPLLAAGTEQQKAQFLSPLTQKASLAGYGSNDSMANELTVMQEHSEFVLNGQHASVINAGQAEWYFLYALTATDSEAAQTSSFAGGLSAFIVPSNTPGLSFEQRVPSLGRKARSVYKAKLKNVRLTADHLVGKSHQANQVAIEILPGVCALIAAGATGVAHSAMQHAIAYSKERKTFGRPIGQHQGVAFLLADMAREIEAARLLTWQAACLIDQGLKTAEHALAAKAYAQDVAMRVATDAVQVYGGYGYSKEYPVEKLMRDAKQYQIFERSSIESKAALARRLVRA